MSSGALNISKSCTKEGWGLLVLQREIRRWGPTIRSVFYGRAHGDNFSYGQ